MAALRRPFRSWWFLAALSSAGYLILPFWFPLLERYDVAPPADIFTFTPSLGAGALYAAWLLAQSAIFLQAYRVVRRTAIAPWRIVAASVTFATPLLLTFPINATDIYRYFIRGRVGGVYGANPFVMPPAGFPGDPFLALAGEWASFTSPYGPAWEMVAGGIGGVAGDRLLAALVAFKVLGALCFVGVGVLLWHVLADRPAGRRRGLLLLWLWNPALMLTFVVNAHNDVLMLFWLLLGWLLLRRNRPVAGWLVALLGPLTKPIGVLALPFLLLEAWKCCVPEAGPRAWRPRMPLLAAVALGSPLVATAAFLPFGNPLDLVGRLLSEASGGAGFSPATLLILLTRAAGANWPLSYFSSAGVIVTGIATVALLWGVLRGRSSTRAVAGIFAVYILVALNFRIWYAAWLFPWLLVDRPGPGTAARRAAGLFFLLAAQLSVLVYAHVRIFLLGGDQLWAHVIGVGVTFGGPLLLLVRRAASDS